jgi:hypothetical protein
MKTFLRYGVACVLAMGAISTHCSAQGRFDLTQQPTATQQGNSSNASLLRSATLRKPDSAMLAPKGMNEGPYQGKALHQDQMHQMQSTQYKIGNTKATSTIYYDESGKVKGTNTTIGGK